MGALARKLADECNEYVSCWLSGMVSLLAVVLLMASVISSEDLSEQVTPKHVESLKNLVSRHNQRLQITGAIKEKGKELCK